MPVVAPASYASRAARARALVAESPHAASVLRFYMALLKQQETVHAWALQWEVHVPSLRDSETGVSALLASIPIPALDGAFSQFVAALKPRCTTALQTAADTLQAASQAIRVTTLRAVATREGFAAVELDGEREPLEFFPRAFLQPLAEARREQLTASRSLPSGACPRCGEAPVVAALQDDTETKGRRYLVCSLCSEWWTFPRLQCPSCSETDPHKLEYHVPEGMAHIRIEECGSCSTYIKSVDLRVDGRSDPIVDDLASVELDLWSIERGLHKIQRNIVGM